MGILSSIFKPRDKPQNRTSGSWYAPYFGGSTSGKVVTERSAMQMTAVYACVRILSEAVAGLPLHLYKYTDSGGKEKAIDHPLYLLLHDEPNPEMSSFVLRETLMTHLLLWGNAYAQVIRNGKGDVVALYPLMPNKMTVSRDETVQRRRITMAKASDVIKIALAEVGYKEKASNSQLDNPTANAGSNNYTKYARDLRDAGYYNGNKNGFAWCDVFVDWCFYKAFGKTEGQRIECQTGDLGAGCKYSKQYYQNKGRCDRKPKVGDQIFFTSGGTISHTGIVTAVNGEKVSTVEGNSGDQVKKHTYSLSNSYIDSFGHPLYDEAEIAPEPEKKTEVRGIDVSKWQGEIAWTKVKADGVKFAMIRLGYGSADGNSCGLDSYFEKNVQNALKAGIDIGCYFYSYAISVEAAKKETEYVVGVLQKYKGVFTYPMVYDLEDKTQQNLGKTVLTDMVIAFGDAIEKAGFYFALYSNLNWLKNYLDDSKLKRFDHWLAQWAPAPTYDGDFGIWQSSSTGSVNGISGNVDTDVAYKDYPKIIREAKLNGFTGTEDKPIVPEQPEPQPTPAFKKGDLVRITGTKYYSGKNIPGWVKELNWIIHSISGDRAVIDKDENGKHGIMSPVNVADLALVEQPADKTKPAVTYTTYTVVRGDCLWNIAKKLLGSGARYKEIKTLNGLMYDTIYVGQVLKIPNR